MTQAVRPEDDEPLRRLRRTPDHSPSRRRSQRRSTGRSPVILIADDSTDTRELYAIYFQSRGFSVVTAHDGAAAIQVALDHEPDVIVMDLAMPQFDGITATQRIKGDARMSRTRVILLTGYPDSAAERGSVGAGADLFLTKPCLPEVLERYVNRLRLPRRSV
jgi:two-component system, OmpR family, KDP operon response regulator KdpE